MIKSKLKELRTIKGYTQQDLANCIATDISNYSRKEKGVVKISHQEWQKIADFLKCELEDIYQEDEVLIMINGDYASGNFGNHNTYIAENKYTIEVQKKYISKLEEEIEILKVENRVLKNK